MRRIGGLGLALALATLVGCGGPEEAELEGTVTYEGQPIDAGAISFVAQGKGAKSGGGAIIDGKIVVNPESRPTPGSYRVEIRWSKLTGKKFKTDTGEMLDNRAEGLPEKYHTNSELKEELKPGKNVLKYDLKK
jgi:hypothetical protein